MRWDIWGLIERVSQLARERVFWPGMEEQGISSYTKSLLLCEDKVTPSETCCTITYHHLNTATRNNRC